MHSSKINKVVIEFSRKVIEGERESATKYFLQSSCNILHDIQVWPLTPEQICCELTATYNYVFVVLSSLICDYKLVSSVFGSLKTNEIIVTALKRVYKCVSDSVSDEGSDDDINHEMQRISKLLENPIFHFKSLAILGRLLLLVTVVCLYRYYLYGSCCDSVSFLVKFTELAGVPVLKEKCHYHHGLLVASCLPIELKGESVKALTIEDVVCFFLATFQRPVHHFAMVYQPWKWLFTTIECRNLMKEKSYSLAMQKLQSALKECREPHQKCKLLCLFAECYFHMNCPQLAIQTYRDALHADNNCYSILYQLALIYQSMEVPDLELESLNLCVMALTDGKKREKDKVPVMEVDELVWSVIPPIEPITLVMSKVTFAKRCLKLKRYQEAADQYSSIIQMLQQDETLLEFERHETKKQLDIAELLVEAAEILLITRQYQECIRLCNNTQPSLSVNDPMVKNSQLINESQTDNVSTNSNSSQSEFFNMLNSSQNDLSLNQLSSSRKKLNLLTSGNDSSADLAVSFERSRRKRLRSGEVLNGESLCQTDDNIDDILMTRLLICKADALVLSSGFTDQAVNCLQQAMDTLLRHPLQASDEDQPCSDKSELQSPHLKRQRLNSDGKASGSKLLKNGGVHSSAVFPNVWSKLLTDTALRMAKASGKRKRVSSVINSCRLVDQLDNGNMDALFMKTNILSENGTLQREAMDVWLNSRGISYLLDKKELEEMVARFQQKLQCEEKSALNWWNCDECGCLKLDITCLKLLLLDVQIKNR